MSWEIQMDASKGAREKVKFVSRSHDHRRFGDYRVKVLIWTTPISTTPSMGGELLGLTVALSAINNFETG